MNRLALCVLVSLALGSACAERRNDDRSNDAPEAKSSRFAAPNTLYAQSKGDDISSSRRNAITNAVAIASPAVVGINVTEIREYQYYDPFADPFFDYFFGGRRRQSPKIQQEIKSLGSGFLISADGYIITNAHVIGNATKVVVTLTDGTKHDARIIGSDDLTDIALLKIDGANFPHLKLGNSDDVIVGEWVIALGNPFGLFEINDKPTVTVGVISSVGLNFPNLDGRSYRGMIQTDAAINSGNSGGPLVNANAEVIGVNTFIYTGGGQGSIGIGFAIPINRVKQIADELRRFGKIDRSFKTGISVQGLNRGLARYFGVGEDMSGVVITNIEKRSAGDKAGLKVGDIIVEANGLPIATEQDLINVVREMRAGDILRLKVFRERRYITADVRLEKT
ncbi:MAG: trypsin-like peptidase domain-containing protein [Chloroherpetonaceae bacterium]|nr:trypsin-like peptidase domain-containing protein [Chloroherpetonaceae bacterium]MDW8437706.1 trypsin-like peptidase domain-containing protein [Chloroherpetonaceae bacterium]